VLNSVLERTGNRVTEAHNLTMPQWMALGCIRHAQEEGVTHSELGQRLMLSKAPITGVVDRLERAGFVTRTTSVSDRRVSCIRITEAGTLVWSQVRDTMRAQAMENCECLGEDGKETILELLSRLLEQVAASDPMLESVRVAKERRQVLDAAPEAKAGAVND
jgi:MarR family 2-MHQ and catechol resistance regulon transcriptional repressor